MEIEIKGIAKKYGKKQVLRDINLTVSSGKCVGILGSNGCGKSTLLSILAKIQKANRGQFLCNGKNLFTDSRLHKNTVSYVPQGTPLIEELTAKDNLSLWYTREDMKRELSGGVLKMLGINEFLKTTVNKMSGGMKKRLSIGCAISKKQPILLLDEPMAALDLACKQEISEYIKSYKQDGGIVLLSTHDLLELQLCDEWYIMKDGVLNPYEFEGDVERLVENL